VIAPSPRPDPTPAALAPRGVVEVGGRKRPNFVMPLPVARKPAVLPPASVERATPAPPPAPAVQPVAALPAAAKVTVRPASLPASLSPITNVPRPNVRSARASSPPGAEHARRDAAPPPALRSAPSAPVSAAPSRPTGQWAPVIAVGSVPRG